MTELLVGTKKGLFVLEGTPGDGFEVTARAFAGEPVEYAMRDPGSGRILAAVTSAFYGPKLHYADDAGGEWTQASGVALPEGGEQALERLWVIVPAEEGRLYMGGDPGVLFESADGGASWSLVRSLWDHPTRPDWQPGGGGLCLHSIVPVAGRAGEARARHVRGRRVADRRRPADVAPRQRGPAARATCPTTPSRP